MKRILLALALCAVSPAVHAQSALEWASQGMGATRAKIAQVDRGFMGRPLDIRAPIQRMIADHVSARIGSQWVGTAQKFTYICTGY